MSCDVGQRCGSDPMLLWLWHRLAATAPIGPLAWELPYAAAWFFENFLFWLYPQHMEVPGPGTGPGPQQQ